MKTPSNPTTTTTPPETPPIDRTNVIRNAVIRWTTENDGRYSLDHVCADIIAMIDAYAQARNAQLETELGEAKRLLADWQERYTQTVQLSAIDLTAALAKVKELEGEIARNGQYAVGNEVSLRAENTRLAGEIERLTEQLEGAQHRSRENGRLHELAEAEAADLRARLSLCEQQRDGGKKDTERLENWIAEHVDRKAFKDHACQSCCDRTGCSTDSVIVGFRCIACRCMDNYADRQAALDAAIAQPQDGQGDKP